MAWSVQGSAGDAAEFLDEASMAFRLRPDESVAHGLRRLAEKELRRARAELGRASPPTGDAIHEARKSVKKVRALLQLVEADDGRRLDACRKRLRSVSRTLSRLRDADAMLSVFEKLRKENPPLFSEHTAARLRRRLASHRREAMEIAKQKGVWKQVDRELRALRKSAPRWRAAHRGFAALAPGIRLAHRRGRKALARARKRQRAADFHEWRKEMKTLWYDLRLVEGRDSRVHKDVAALDRAETLLGDDHNAVVLCAELSKDPSVCGTAADVDRLRLAADRFQCKARTRALKAARRIYARPSRDYLRSVRRGWQGKARRPRRANRGARGRAA
jgi:CHAD domain-containing protein